MNTARVPVATLEPGTLTVFVYLLAIAGTLCLLAWIDIAGKLSEAQSFVYSLTVAGIFWLIALRAFRAERLGTSLIVLINLLLLLKICSNLYHFYAYFCPAAGIKSSKDLLVANFTGDSPVIQHSTMIFENVFRNKGPLVALFGDYYRAINNPGVAIIFGTFKLAFGEYPINSIPWLTLAIGLSSLLLASCGLFFCIDLNHIRRITMLLILMPVFFVTPVNYRDQFMILLSIVLVYFSIQLASASNLSSLFAVVITAICLGSLRTVYVVLPTIAVFFSYLSQNTTHKHRTPIRTFTVFAFLGAVALVGLFKFSTRLDAMASQVQFDDHSFGVLARLKALGPMFYYPGVLIYSFLAPFPWWQTVKPSLFVYQIFNYPQSLLGITIVLAYFFSKPPKGFKRIASPFSATAFTMYVFAIAGSNNLGWSYIQIIMPLLLLPAAYGLYGSFGTCLGVSSIYLLFMHVLYWFNIM